MNILSNLKEMEIKKADFDSVPTLDNFKDLYNKEFHKPIRINHKS